MKHPVTRFACAMAIVVSMCVANGAVNANLSTANPAGALNKENVPSTTIVVAPTSCIIAAFVNPVGCNFAHANTRTSNVNNCYAFNASLSSVCIIAHDCTVADNNNLGDNVYPSPQSVSNNNVPNSTACSAVEGVAVDYGYKKMVLTTHYFSVVGSSIANNGAGVDYNWLL